MRLIILTTTLFFILAFATSPTQAQDALGPGFYDQVIPAILYQDFSWQVTADANNYGGSRTGTNLTTSTTPKIRFKVWGDGFVLYLFRNPSGGQASLSVNGVVVATIDYFAAANTYLSTFSISGLGWGGDGIHDILIQKTTTTNTAITMDAVHVLPHVAFPTAIVPTYPPINVTFVIPTAQPTPTGTLGVWVLNLPEQTPEATPEHQQSLTIGGQPSIISYEINPMDVVLVIFVAFGVFIGCVSFVVNLWGKK